MQLNKLSLYFFCLIFFSCSNNEHPYENSMGIKPSVLAEMDTANYTTIKWSDTLCDFGTIRKGDSVQCKYVFTNSGSTALFIFNSQTTCGCTVTDFPKDPVMPGKSGAVTVTFKSRSDEGEINKRIIIIANTKKSKKNSLFVHGIIKPIEK